MPWTKTDYPVSWKNLDATVRNKAVDIANALLEEGYAEGSAIAIATAQAKRWAEGRDEKDESQAYRVVKHPEGWAVRRANGRRASSVHETKEEARNQAILYARNEGVDVVIHDEDGNEQDFVSLVDEVQPIVERAVQTPRDS